MTKKVLMSVVTLFLGIGLGFFVWLFCMDGLSFIKDSLELPTEPEGNYSGFYYNNLDKQEKIAYELIAKQILDMPERIQIPNVSDNFSDLFEALIYDNPKYFFFAESFNVETNSFGKCFFIPEYSMTPDEYESRLEELENVKDIVLQKMSGKTDEYELEKAAHDYIVENCEYIDKTGGAYSSAYGCLVNGVASCEGYAKAMKYLLDELKIESYIVTGTAKNQDEEAEGHAWNIVKIDDEFYHLDSTWNDPISDGIQNNYAYFNVTDKEISKTHQLGKTFNVKCEKTDANYYVKENIVFSKYDGETRASITSEIARQAKIKHNIVSFKFADKKVLDNAVESLFDLDGIYSVLVSASLLTDSELVNNSVKYSVDEENLIITITDFIKN